MMMRILILLGLAAALTLGGCEQEQQDRITQQPAERQTGEQPAADRDQQAMAQEDTGQHATEQQEFLGQSPAFGDAPETIVLEAKNGNVTFSHKSHAEQMECQECHQGTPGKIEDFGKDQAHELCKGCHEEQGAGPTKCSECHKK